MVRRHVILCNFDPLRAIILRDRLLVIVPEGADSLLVDLERRVRGGMEEYENSVFGDASDEDKDASIHRYQKKPSSVTMNKAKRKITKAVKNAVKKPASLVKNAMGRNSSKHPSVTVPPPTLTPTMSVLASDTKKSDGPTNPNNNDDEDEEEFAELQSSEWEELKGNKWKELPFELQCTDGKRENLLSAMEGLLLWEPFRISRSFLNPFSHSSRSLEWFVRRNVRPSGRLISTFGVPKTFELYAYNSCHSNLRFNASEVSCPIEMGSRTNLSLIFVTLRIVYQKWILV